jgi:hypothetical protein
MKQLLPLLLATGLVATLGGCQSATDVDQSATEVGPSDFTLVTLKVPNMV